MSAVNVSGFGELWAAASQSGAAAAEAVSPIPMTVVGGSREYFVAEGVCGFAWVVVKPGTARFAKWLVKMGHARKHWAGGVCVWISAYNQSMQRKEAHARAMAESFRAAGVQAYADSRMD